MACKTYEIDKNGNKVREITDLELKQDILKRFADKPIDLNEIAKEFSGAKSEISTPKEVKVDNAPKGNHLNIGMKVGRGDEMLTQEEILAKLPKGVKVESVSVVEGTEPTLSVKTSRKLTDAEMTKLMDDTQQQAIPQLTDGVGVLHDAKAGTDESWGDFNPDYFVTQDGKKLSEAKAEKPLSKKEKALKAIEEKRLAKAKEAIDSVKKSLKVTGIEVVDDPAEYQKAVDEGNGQKGMEGMFVADNGKIYLDSEKLKGEWGKTIVFHEGTHPVVNIIRNTNKALYDSMISGLNKAAETNADIREVMDWAKEKYGDEGAGRVEDETIVETIARIGDGRLKLNEVPKSVRQSVVDLVNKAAKMLGFDQVLSDTDPVAFKRMSEQIANALRTGQNIEEVVGKENVKKYENTINRAIEFNEEGTPVYSGNISQARVASAKAEDVYEEKEVEGLKPVSLGEVLKKFGNKAVIINSDPTRVGKLKLPSGKEIFMYGGSMYGSIKENIQGNVGFATTQMGKVTSHEKLSKSIFGEGNKGVTLVATQTPFSLLSNSYSLRVVLDAISQLPKSVRRSSEFKNEFFGKDILLLKTVMGEDGYKNFVSKYSKLDLGDQDAVDGMIKDMAYKFGEDNSPASFNARGSFVSNLLAGITPKLSRVATANEAGYVSKEPNKFIAKRLKSEFGLTTEKMFYDLGQKNVVDQFMDKGNWGFVTSGFETNPSIKSESVQSKGVKHPLFNAKFAGENPFVLDGLYSVDKLLSPQDIIAKSGEPYTKKASLMLSKSMYVGGGEKMTGAEGASVFKLNPKTSIQESKGGRGDYVKDTYYEPHMTESKDKKDYVFFHVSGADAKELAKGIDSSKKYSTRTSREEKALQYGVASYYTKPSDGERMVGGEKYAVHVPKDKVYPMDTDPNGYREKAEVKIKEGTPFREERVRKEIAEAAKKDGYLGGVGEWGYDRTGGESETPALRFDAFVPLKPEKEMASSYKPATTKEISHPDKQALIAQNKLMDLAEGISAWKSSKQKYDDAYDIAERMRIYGGEISPEDFKTLTEGLPTKLAKQAKEIQLSKGGRNADVDEYHDDYVEVAKSGIEDDPNYSIEDLAKDTGYSVDDLQGVWEDATKKDVSVTGVSAKARGARADELGTDAAESGQGWTGEDALIRGNKLLTMGVDPIEMLNDKDIELHDKVAIAQAYSNKLGRESNAIADKFGEGSIEHKDAVAKEDEYAKQTKPLATLAHKAFAGHQGAVEVDTGSWTGMKKAFEAEHGKKPTPQQEKEAKELSDKVKELTQKVDELEKKAIASMDKSISDSEDKTPKSYTKKAKDVADVFRKLKTKPFTFKDSNGNEVAVHTMGVTWNDAVELGAKAIEKTGEIADGVAAAIDHIKEAKWYKGLSDEDKKRFEEELHAHYTEADIQQSDIHTKFLDKKDNKFDPKEVKEIWQYAKDNYLDKGSRYNDMLNGVAKDLGLTKGQVINAIAQPKNVREITLEMYAKQNKRTQAINEAKAWVRTANEPKLTKILKGIPNLWFAKAVFGHGTVGMTTHAGTEAFNPETIKYYVPRYFEQFQNAFGAMTEQGLGKYEMRMLELQERPNFMLAKRAGLKNDPTKSSDDYTGTKFRDRFTKSGDRGFNTLKAFRQDLFDHYYNKASAIERADPTFAKQIATMVNHATGTSDFTPPKWANTVFFAPRLLASVWSRLTYEPYKAVETFSNWSNATPADKAIAKITTKRIASIAATYASLLAVNQAMLSLSGSKQKINVTDPTQSDFLKFKAGDTTFEGSGGIVPSIKFIGSLIAMRNMNKKDRHGKPIGDKAAQSVGAYESGKLSPFAATAKEVFTKHDYNGNTMPWSNAEPDHSYNHKLTWKEYLWSQAPIPAAEAAKDVYMEMENEGLSKPAIEMIFNGAVKGAMAGGTGWKVGVSPKDKSTTPIKATPAKATPTGYPHK